MRRSVSWTLRDRYPWEAALMSCCWAAAVVVAAAATAASRPVNRSPWETTTDNPAVPDHGTWTWVEDWRPLSHYCGVGTLLGNPAETTRHNKLYSGISLTLVYSSTNMSKSVWTSGFWKPLVHKNMSNFWNNIFHKLGLHFARVRILRTFNVWMSELWCGQVTFLNHSSTIRVPKNP